MCFLALDKLFVNSVNSILTADLNFDFFGNTTPQKNQFNKLWAERGDILHSKLEVCNIFFAQG